MNSYSDMITGKVFFELLIFGLGVLVTSITSRSFLVDLELEDPIIRACPSSVRAAADASILIVE